jgi:hypothetical protein
MFYSFINVATLNNLVSLSITKVRVFSFICISEGGEGVSTPVNHELGVQVTFSQTRSSLTFYEEEFK